MFTRFRDLLAGKEEIKVKMPAITTTQAIIILVLYTIIYVFSFYLSPTTRPSPTLSRDAPSVIRGRIKAVTFSCLLCTTSTFIILTFAGEEAPLSSLHKLGYFPLGIVETIKSLALTAVLFLGPLFEEGIVDGCWRDWIRLRGFNAIVGSWIGWRNLVAGPITEEILFRSTSIPLLLLAQTQHTTIVYLTPLIFGLAHIHHFYEYTISHPHSPILPAILRSLFQLSYTTLFGAYTTFIYLRTGSLLAVILIHTFCNWQGLPRFWGRLEGSVETEVLPVNSRTDDSVGKDSKKSDERNGNIEVGTGKLSIMWTIAYYVILVIGAVSFYKLLFTLTESPDFLATF